LRGGFVVENGEKFLGEAAVKNGFISQAQLEECRKVQSQSSPPASLASILVSKKLLTDGQLGILLGLYRETIKIGGAPEEHVDAIGFGEIAVRKRMTTNEEVWKAIEEQTARREKGSVHRLGEILTERGTLTVFQAQEILEGQGKRILKCTVCSKQYNVRNFSSEKDYTCLSCGAPLEVPRILSTVAVHGTAADDVSHKVEMDDRFVGKNVGGCEIVEKIGEGGMGSVYKAKHLALNKTVAVKIMSAALMGEVHRKRFLREARAAARLDHPNVITIHDTGEYEGYNFIVMQFIDGEGVGSILEREGRIPEKKAVHIIKQAAIGLGCAHKQNMIHRDVKPDNIMITKDGQVKVTDFGLVKSAEVEKDLTGMSKSMLMGTPHYMAPEQFEGQTVDHRTDIYALGVTFYHMLTGKRPYHGTTPYQIMQGHLAGGFMPPERVIPDISPFTSRIVTRMMAKDRDKRYSSTDQIVEDLERAEEYLRSGGRPPVEQEEYVLEEGEEPVAVKEPSRAPTPGAEMPAQVAPSTPAGVSAKRSKLISILAAVILIAVAAGVTAYFLTRKKEPALPSVVPVAAVADIEKEAEEAFQNLKKTSDALLAKEQFYGALKQLSAFPEKYDATKAKQKVELEKARVMQSAVDKFKEILAEIKRLKDEGRLEEARKKTQELTVQVKDIQKEFGSAPGTSQLASIASAANEVITEQKDPYSAERARFASEKKRAEELALAGDYDGAIAIYKGFIASRVTEISTESRSRIEELQKKKDLAELDAERRLFAERDTEGLKLISENKFNEARDTYGPFRVSRVDEVRTKANERLAEIDKREAEAQKKESETAVRNDIAKARQLLNERKLGEARTILERYTNHEREEFRKEARELLMNITTQETFRKDMERVDAFRGEKKFQDALVLCEKYTGSETEEFAKEAREKHLAIKKERYLNKGLIYSTGGKFTVGSKEASDKNPEREVTVSPFYIEKFEVTNEQYRKFVEDTGHEAPLNWQQGRPPRGKEKQPVVWVTYQDAVQFCKWRSEKEGTIYRLPAEAEWEIASSYDGQKKSTYPWGDQFSKEFANLNGAETAEVGSFAKDVSPLGIYDMGGNVCEWVQSDEKGALVVRGGSFTDSGDQNAARTTFRHRVEQDTRGAGIGFRCIREDR
jgi:formylglycine-generating enzyme required for sulfatase activity/tRNA A-37 threonylcarbamoyl transferase component Bud32